MRTLTIKVSTEADLIADVVAGKPRVDVYSFPSWEALHTTLTPKKLDILAAMKGKGPLGMREVSRMVERGYKGVHTDLTALLNIGLLDRSGDGIVFPYDDLHVDFYLASAAA
jgi:predicted transcriptional regulator